MLSEFSFAAWMGLLMIMFVPITYLFFDAVIHDSQANNYYAPFAFAFIACMFVKLILLALRAADSLDAEAERLQVPDWINTCIDSNVEIDLKNLEEAQIGLQKMATLTRTLALLLSIYSSMVAFVVGFAFSFYAFKLFKKYCCCKVDRQNVDSDFTDASNSGL